MSPAPASPARPLTSPEPLLTMMHGLATTAVLSAAIRLGAFDQIDAGRRDLASIAGAMEASERGTRVLLDGLVKLGLVEYDGEYGLSALADAFLVTSRPAYLGGMLDVIVGSWAWTGYPRLDEAVRAGGTVLERDAETPEHPYWETFARSSAGFAPASALLASTIEPWAVARERLEILDVACGAAQRSMTVAREQPHARVTLLDWPNVLPVARDTVDQFELNDRTSYIPGDLFTVDLGGPYDLIVVSLLLHHFSRERCVELLRRLRATLAPDGRIAIDELVAAPSIPDDDPFLALFGVAMLVWTEEGEAHSLATYESMLEQAGFTRPTLHRAPGVRNRLLISQPRETT